MLGKLTRWLRMLGHDVHYYRSKDDKELLEIAESENRIILTRDLALYQQAVTKEIEAALVEAETVTGKLANLAGKYDFSLEIDLRISRCPKCNCVIKLLSKDQTIQQIPKATSNYFNEFWKCKECDQLYWQGAHWKNIEKTLKEAKELLNLDQF